MSIVVWNSHETVKCPPGTIGWHPRHGRVRILKADGWKRLVEVRAESAIVASTGAVVTYPERRLLLVDVRELDRAWYRHVD